MYGCTSERAADGREGEVLDPSMRAAADPIPTSSRIAGTPWVNDGADLRSARSTPHPRQTARDRQAVRTRKSSMTL
jgi:hypothetical protein